MGKVWVKLYFCGVKVQNSTKMEDKQQTYFRDWLQCSVQGQANPNMRVMRGKALLDQSGQDFKFVENPPRGPRSVEVGRSMHGRVVRRPDKLYTLTLRLDAGSKYLMEATIAEVREVIKAIQTDAKAVAAAEKAAAKATKEEKGGDDGQGVS